MKGNDSILLRQNENICDSLKQHIIDSLSPLIESDYLFLDLPYYSNIGDTLIWLGTEEFFKGLSGKCIGRHSKETFDFRVIPHDCTILLQGGGNMGDLWREHQEFRNEVVCFYPDNNIIFLPQTIYYKSTDILQSDLNLLNKHQHLTICARDEYSINLLKNNGFKGKLLLIPDMAFCINRQNLRSMMLRADDECLFLMRNDKESPKQGSQRADIFKNAEFADWPSIQESGAMAWDYIQSHESKETDLFFQNNYFFERIEEGVKFASKYKTAYSTRLHFVILRLLLGLKVNVLDNSYGKNLHFVDTWLKDSPLINIVSQEDMQIIAIILDYNEKKCQHFKSFKDDIDKLEDKNNKLKSCLENLQKENVRLLEIVGKNTDKIKIFIWIYVITICIIILIYIIN